MVCLYSIFNFPMSRWLVASPYLLSLGLSKSSMAIVFVAGPLSGLIMQPLIGKQCIKLLAVIFINIFVVVQAFWPTILPRVLVVGGHTCCWEHSCAWFPCCCWASVDLSRRYLQACILAQYVVFLWSSNHF